MSAIAVELETISPELALWRAYDPSIKTDLFSTAVSTAEATWVIDPIDLAPAALTGLQNRSPIHGIIVTNQNHLRASSSFAGRLSVPVFAHPAVKSDDKRRFTSLSDGQQLDRFLQVRMIDGAAPGEIAVIARTDRTTMVIGDALINFEPYGFTFLPRKYCTNYTKMRQSLKRLAEFDVEQIFFAHGLPILSNGGSRLKALLDEI